MKALLNQNYHKIYKLLISKKRNINIFVQSTPKTQNFAHYWLQNFNLKCFNYSRSILQTKYYFSENKKSDLSNLSKEEAFKKSEEQLMNADPDQDPYTYKQKIGSGKYILGAGVLFLTALIAYVEWKMRKDNQTLIQQNVKGLQTISKKNKANIGGDWSLIDLNGNKFTSKDLQGSYYIIYFGFTKCPDICPATLYKMSRVLKYIQTLPQAQYINLKLVFVSVDPERDSPSKIKQYLKNFDSKIIGVTATKSQDQQLKNCMKKFKIYANKVQQQNKEYSVDHTTIAYLMDDNNQYMDYLNPNLTEKQLAKFLVNQILQKDQKKMKQKEKQAKKT